MLKLNPLTNYQIADELEMPLSSVCARVRELQVLDLVLDSCLRRETKYGKQEGSGNKMKILVACEESEQLQKSLDH